MYLKDSSSKQYSVHAEVVQNHLIYYEYEIITAFYAEKEEEDASLLTVMCLQFVTELFPVAFIRNKEYQLRKYRFSV